MWFLERKLLLIFVFTKTIKYSLGLCRTNNIRMPCKQQFDLAYFCSRNNYGLLYGLNCDYLINDFDELNNDRNVQAIEITNSTFSKIGSGIFRSFPRTVYLSINISDITVIEPGAFNGLPALRILNLTKNNIKTLQEGVFNALIALETLDLSQNQINEIKDNSLLGMHVLQELYLNDNEISDMKPVLAVCEKLKFLELSNNQIEAIYISSSCVKLEYLNIASNKIKILTKDVFQNIPNLKSLDLSRNALFEIDAIQLDSFQNTLRLERLNLSSTGINNIKVGTFSRLQKLRYLDISSNNLKYLPKGLFYGLTSLLGLYLNDNHLTYLDDLPQKFAINLDNNLWDCGSLSTITRKLGADRIIYGSTYNTTNLLGIGCTEQYKNFNNSQTSDLSTNTDFQKEYLAYLAKSQQEMSQTLSVLRMFLNQSSLNQKNRSEIGEFKNFLNKTNFDQKTYLEKLFALLKNKSDTTQKIETETQLDVRQTILELKNMLGRSNPLQTNYTSFLESIRQILSDIKNALTPRESQGLSMNLSHAQYSGLNQEPVYLDKSDTTVLYFIFISILAVLAAIISLLFIKYRKYKHFGNRNEELILNNSQA